MALSRSTFEYTLFKTFFEKEVKFNNLASVIALVYLHGKNGNFEISCKNTSLAEDNRCIEYCKDFNHPPTGTLTTPRQQNSSITRIHR
jgi:hypothetical protein